MLNEELRDFEGESGAERKMKVEADQSERKEDGESVLKKS